MTPIDVEWFKRCHAAGLVKGRMLEVGSAKIDSDANLCEIARQLGVSDTTGADIESTEGVDVVADFGLDPAEFQKQWHGGQFPTVCVFNVLEHTFDPITVLRNSLSCLESNGTLLVVVPSIWPIHNYPRDYNRLLPDWYVTFGERNGIQLMDQHFCWLSEFGIETIFGASKPSLPAFTARRSTVPALRYWMSRVSHKLLNTYGRSHWATHSAIGAAFVRK